MQWEAHTASEAIGEGTILHILASPQVAGQSPDILSGGEDINITTHGPTSSIVKARINSASAVEAELELLRDGSKWRMTPWTANDRPANFENHGMASQDWVIRSKA